jgi:hypothetical protein
MKVYTWQNISPSLSNFLPGINSSIKLNSTPSISIVEYSIVRLLIYLSSSLKNSVKNNYKHEKT